MHPLLAAELLELLGLARTKLTQWSWMHPAVSNDMEPKARTKHREKTLHCKCTANEVSWEWGSSYAFFFKACSVLQGLNSFHFSGYCSDSGSLCSTTLYWRMRRNVAGMLKRAGRSLLQCVTQQFNTATAGKADRWDCCKRKDAYVRACMYAHSHQHSPASKYISTSSTKR